MNAAMHESRCRRHSPYSISVFNILLLAVTEYDMTGHETIFRSSYDMHFRYFISFYPFFRYHGSRIRSRYNRQTDVR